MDRQWECSGGGQDHSAMDQCGDYYPKPHVKGAGVVNVLWVVIRADKIITGWRSLSKLCKRTQSGVTRGTLVVLGVG